MKIRLPVITLRIITSACLAACSLGPAMAFAQGGRFSAQFGSGKRLDGAEIHDWHNPRAEPRLDNQKLFFQADHVQWIDDNSIPPAERPEAYVEFFGGDRLPGRVLEYRTGQESVYHKSPPCLIVAPAANIDWPEMKRPPGLSVIARGLRRVVWKAREDDRFRPGMLFYLDGRQIEFRGLRWSKNAVRLLLEQETRDVAFEQIAEIHLPRINPWDAWFDQLAALLPEGDGFVIQVETGDGLRATTSTPRMCAATRGDASKPDNWYHGIRPAWSLAPLWLRHRTIRTRRFFALNVVPLSAIEPSHAIQRANLAGGWNWQLDRNVHAWPMRCGDHSFSWGFGVHAYSELGFDLPACSRTFQTQYGLDDAVGPGGCVRAAIFAGAASGQPLHRSEHVIGSLKSHDTGPLSVAGATQLTLVVDPAQNDRPAGADPFEIRDTFDWLQPSIELDSEALKAELARRSESPLVSWPGWSVVGSDTRPCQVSIAWDPLTAAVRLCRVEVRPRDRFFSIARQLEIGSHDRFLVLSVNRLEKDTAPSRLQVRIDGRAIAEFDVPLYTNPGGPDPLLVPVDRYQKKTVEVELVQMAESPQSRVEWLGIGLADRNPLVFEAFDDDPEFVAELADGTGTGQLEKTDKFTGSASLRVTPDDKNNPAMPGWVLPIRSDPNPGEYRFVRFAWKKRGGKQIGLHLAQSGAFAPAAQIESKLTLRYHVGRGVKHDYGKSVQFRDNPPDQWDLVTRDLFGDFGAFDASGIRLVCGDGEWAEFDHIYFARRVQDLDRLTQSRQKPAVDPLADVAPDVKANIERVATDPARFGEVLWEVAPAFSTAASEQGVWLLKTFQGKTHVVRTHPPAQGKPCVLRAPLHVPADKHTELRLTVAHHPQSDWQLLVFANGEKLHDGPVAEGSTKEGWADITIDLSRFAGHDMVLEVHNHPNNWSNEFAYWSRLEVVSQ